MFTITDSNAGLGAWAQILPEQTAASGSGLNMGQHQTHQCVTSQTGTMCPVSSSPPRTPPPHPARLSFLVSQDV